MGKEFDVVESKYGGYCPATLSTTKICVIMSYQLPKGIQISGIVGVGVGVLLLPVIWTSHLLQKLDSNIKLDNAVNAHIPPFHRVAREVVKNCENFKTYPLDVPHPKTDKDLQLAASLCEVKNPDKAEQLRIHVEQRDDQNNKLLGWTILVPNVKSSYSYDLFVDEDSPVSVSAKELTAALDKGFAILTTFAYYNRQPIVVNREAYRNIINQYLAEGSRPPPSPAKEP